MLPAGPHLLRCRSTVPPASGSQLTWPRPMPTGRSVRTLRPLQAAALAYRIALARVPATIGLAANPGDRKAAALTHIAGRVGQSDQNLARHQRQIVFSRSVARVSYP